jgi:uncharacterized protein
MSSRRAVTATLLALGALVVAFGVVRLLDSDDDAPRRAARSLSAVIARATPAQAPFDGLTEVHLGVGADHCLRLAIDDTGSERVAGLRDHTDLGPYDGMLFVFPGQTNSAFTMSGVTVPLDIGFFAGDGTRTSTLLMKPCAKAEPECPTYRADDTYRYAIETLAGKLPSGSVTACTGG